MDGRYEVLERLGEGGAGVVYRGRQTHLGRFVAIKVLHQDTASSTEWRRRFQREAMALSVLAHPHVVPVTDFGVDHGVPFLVMELLEGQTLAALIKEGPLPLWRALEIARQTLRVLAFSHIKGVVHGDLKPTNVFLQALPDQADHVRLLDFGMAKFVEGSSSRAPADLTRAGVMIGTPAYMSPEQVKCAPTDARTDVYAAGLLLFELLAGRRPFVAESPEGYLAAHLTAPTPSLAKSRRGLARASLFQAVVEQAMAKKPAERFKDAYAMAVALEDVVARLPAAVVSRGRAEARRTPMPRAGSAAPSGSRFWPRVMLLVTLAAGIVAVEEYLRHEGAKQAKTTGVPAAQPRTATQPSPPPTPPAPSLPSPEPEPPTSPPVKVQAPMDPEPPERPAQLQIEAKAAQGARDPWREPVPRPLRRTCPQSLQEPHDGATHDVAVGRRHPGRWRLHDRFDRRPKLRCARHSLHQPREAAKVAIDEGLAELGLARHGTDAERRKAVPLQHLQGRAAHSFFGGFDVAHGVCCYHAVTSWSSRYPLRLTAQ